MLLDQLGPEGRVGENMLNLPKIATLYLKEAFDRQNCQEIVKNARTKNLKLS